MKQMKMIMTGLVLSVLVAACGKSKSESGSPVPPAPAPPPLQDPKTAPPPQTQTSAPIPPKSGGDIPTKAGGNIVAPISSEENPLLPGVPYSPTPLPLPGTQGSRRAIADRDRSTKDPNLTPQERQEIEQENQRRRRREEDRARRDQQSTDVGQTGRQKQSPLVTPAPTTRGGIDDGPTPLPPTTKKSDELPPIRRSTPVEEQAGQAWYPPQVFETPAAAWLRYQIDPILNSVKNAGPQGKVLSNRVKVTLALGYFDGFHSEKFVYAGENYGRHVAVDPFLRSAVDAVLTRDCSGARLQVCGFELKAINDVEATYVRGGVDGIIQEIRVLSGAISPLYSVTTGSRAEEQRRRSTRAAEAFSRSFLDSDLIVYVGHSRLGGGPDFEPPRLKGNEVDYKSYEKDRPGAHRILRAVKDPNRRARFLALLSCDSTDHFLGEIRHAGSDLQVATMKGNIKSEDQMTGGLLAVDLFLRQGSLNGYQKFVSGSAVLGSAVTVVNAPHAARR